MTFNFFIVRSLTHYFTLPAKIVVPKPSNAMSVNDQRKLDAWAIKPISGGPIKKPRKLMVETAASAIAEGIVVDFPASPYTTGTTHETPKPTSKNPVIAVNI